MSFIDSAITIIVMIISMFMGISGSAGVMRVILRRLRLSEQDNVLFSEEYITRHKILVSTIFRNGKVASFASIMIIFMYNPLPVLFFFVPAVVTSVITTVTILLAKYNRSFFGRLINFKSH